LEVEEGDVGAAPFEAACRAQAEITIELHREGLLQRWSGKVEAVKPAMGFINVMRPDFHLHLRAGSVHGWRVVGETGDVELEAHNAEGQATGLVVRGPASVLAVAQIK
jgi:putative heme degradation protein